MNFIQPFNPPHTFSLVNSFEVSHPRSWAWRAVIWRWQMSWDSRCGNADGARWFHQWGFTHGETNGALGPWPELGFQLKSRSSRGEWCLGLKMEVYSIWIAIWMFKTMAIEWNICEWKNEWDNDPWDLGAPQFSHNFQTKPFAKVIFPHVCPEIWWAAN